MSSLISLLPLAEYELWVREMTISGLEFKNPVGLETFDCFKRICIIERNTCESARTDSAPVDSSSTGSKKVAKSSHKVTVQEKEYSDTESEVGIHATSSATPRKPWWDPPAGLKFPCPVGNHKHEVSSCAEFFNLSPLDRWEKIEHGRMCYTCLKPKTVCKTRKCEYRAGVPEILTCALCAAWAEPQAMAPFSIFFCRNKYHSSARAPLSALRAELEKYIGKLGTAVVDAKIKFSVNFFRENGRSRGRRNRVSNPRTLDLAPTFNSQTGDQLVIQPEAVDLEIKESSSYILQNIKIGKSECLVFFDSGANSHLIDGSIAVKEGLQAVSNKRT